MCLVLVGGGCAVWVFDLGDLWVLCFGWDFGPRKIFLSITFISHDMALQ